MRQRLTDRIVLTLATGLGVGHIPKAPGTFGSLWGLPLVWLMQEASLGGAAWAAVGGVIALLGVPLCGRAAAILGQKDPGCVVYDEIAAFPLVFALTPVTLRTAILGFALFRLFDIWKPWPAGRLERLPGGWGIMADDLAAALYAGGILALLAGGIA